MAEAVVKAGGLSPRTCRDHVATSYSVGVMVEGYERIFQRVLARS
jgi:hypothetical protein